MNTAATITRYLDRAIDVACQAANDASVRCDWQAGERLERSINCLEDRYDRSLPELFGATS